MSIKQGRLYGIIFLLVILGGYNYAPKCPNRIVPYNLCVNSYIIDRGYHSYKWMTLIQIVDVWVIWF